MAVGGGSAERRAEQLGAAGDPASGAWAAGAAGERRVVLALSNLLESWTVLHDRLLRPGRSEVNLDHVVIGPSGVYLVDAKSRAGRVVEWEGGLFQHTTRNGNAVSVNLGGELAKVHGMAAAMAETTGLRVTPVLCLAGAREAEFGAPQQVRGVWVVPVSRLVAWLLSWPYAHSREEVERMATRTMTDFPSTTTHPDLLRAMGAAAAPRGSGPPTGPPARGMTPASLRATSRPRRNSEKRKGLLLRLIVGVAVLVAAPTVVPAFAEWAGPLVSKSFTGPTSTPTASAFTPSPSTIAPAKAGSKPVAASPSRRVTAKPAPAPPLDPDCEHATQAEISRILGRRVQPVAVSSGCAWGTRIDDRSTVLVSIEFSSGNASYDYRFKTSAQHRRVVYGTGLDQNYRPATTLVAAKGVRLTSGSKATLAPADLMVMVATTVLGLTDDQARAKALRIAVATTT